MAKYYAVKKGLSVGIFSTWPECEAQVKNYSGAQYKSFSSIEEARNYLDGTSQVKSVEVPVDPNKIIVYVDGSFNPKTNMCGYASYLQHSNKFKIICGQFLMEFDGRNVEGEVRASVETLKYLKTKNYKNITIYYDYEGVCKWADHLWRANKSYTQEYTKFIDNLRAEGFNIEFKHVESHTGITGNEYVDKIAKIACGVELTNKEKELIKPIEHINGFPKI